MNIDLFTFVAQVINLIILLILLRKFLYLPVLRVVEARQKLIDDELKKAETSMKKANALEQECHKKLAEIDLQKQDILTKTHAEAQHLAEKLTQEAQQEFVKNRGQWQKKLFSEQTTFEKVMQNLVVENFQIFATNALQQMADVSLNDLMIKKLQEKIANLPIKKKNEMAEIYRQQKAINIQISGKLNSTEQKELQHFLQEQFGLLENVKFSFTTNKNLICGIAILAQDNLIEWNLAAYYEDFRKNMNNEVARLMNRG